MDLFSVQLIQIMHEERIKEANHRYYLNGEYIVKSMSRWSPVGAIKRLFSRPADLKPRSTSKPSRTHVG